MTLMVRKKTLLLVCLAFSGNGRRVHPVRHEPERQTSSEVFSVSHSPESPAEVHQSHGQAVARGPKKILTALSTLLLAHNPKRRSPFPSGPQCPRAARRSEMLLSLHGGATDVSDEFMKQSVQADLLSSALLAEAAPKVAEFRKKLASGEVIPALGKEADELVEHALDTFGAQTPVGDAKVAELYQAKAEELRKALMTSLEPAFAQQICLLRGNTMEQFLKRVSSSSSDSAQALATAEAEFVREAGASLPSHMAWFLKLERASLTSAMRTIIIEKKKHEGFQAASSSQMQTALTYLQMQQQQMQDLQSKYIGGQGCKWDVAVSHRPPDMDINFSGKFEPKVGGTKLHLYMLPDEGAAILGPYGFTLGVGPANLGLNFNIRI